MTPQVIEEESYNEVDAEGDLIIVGGILGGLVVLVITSLVVASILYNRKQARAKLVKE